jgi:succinate dehydrogenase/fumarate reductase flavoprotein subunit
MAHRAGADIGNMEFITFCCNVFYHPPMWRGSIAPYVLGMLTGHRLTNSRGETFLDKYDPYVVKIGSGMEWNKSFISFASAREIRAGLCGPAGGIFFSRGDIPWETTKIYCQALFPNWKYKALDLSEWGRKLETDEPVEVGPAVEYFDGGIIINERFETSLTGLFAAGECTMGAFGANRVFSAITEMLVQGAEAGRNAGEFALRNQVPDPDREMFSTLEAQALKPLSRDTNLNPAGIRRQVQESAQRKLGPIRNREELESFLYYLEKVKTDEIPNLSVGAKTRVYNKQWIDALEMSSMVHLLEAAARSALFRQESRGVHFREDFPQTDNNRCLEESVIRSGGFEVTGRPITVSGLTPPSGVKPFLESVKMMMEAHSDVGGHH